MFHLMLYLEVGEGGKGGGGQIGLIIGGAVSSLWSLLIGGM